MRYEENYFTLSTGRRFYAYGGVLGINEYGPRYGWDGDVPEDDCGPFTAQEKQEIAYHVIARWIEWAEK